MHSCIQGVRYASFLEERFDGCVIEQWFSARNTYSIGLSRFGIYRQKHIPWYHRPYGKPKRDLIFLPILRHPVAQPSRTKVVPNWIPWQRSSKMVMY